MNYLLRSLILGTSLKLIDIRRLVFSPRLPCFLHLLDTAYRPVYIFLEFSSLVSELKEWLFNPEKQILIPFESLL
jgi:hypothetical protein